ncbi:MAG: endonuclease MutS2 [Bacteroidetes bacterium]|nr:endonuclease MutS2 [Bacteroidota bacterium]MCL5737369.1 endonuclease MutS2 [Bacteroidota bacterium]
MIERDSELLRSFEKLEFPKLISFLKTLCQTELGEKYLDDIPLIFDKGSLEKEYVLVDQAHSLSVRNIFPDLTGVKDVRASLARASKEGSFLLGKELRDISKLLHVVESARKSLLKQKNELREISEIGFQLYPDSILEFNINRAMDEEGNVRDDASKELHRIRASLNHTRSTLRKKIMTIARSFSEMEYSEEDIFTQRDGRLVLPVKAEFKRQIPGLIHGSSATGQTVFIEPSFAVDLNNEVISLQFEEQREIEKILRELTERIRGVVPQLVQDVEVIAYLDSFYARAVYAMRLRAVVPAVGVVKVPRLVKARHPLLVIKMGRDKVTPIDMFLDDTTHAVVISGPNSGGKTVTLKTVGLFVLCNLAAIPLTADPGTELPIYENIFTDIGDEQSIENDLSTFTSRIKHFVEVLLKANDKSMVLVDEFGEETEPAEGAALASAMLEDLRDIGSTSFVTTHNSGLKVFAADAPGMLNAAMEFDQKTLTPTYKLVLGRPGSSYAFEIAQRTGLKQKIVERARKYVGEGRDKLENLLLRVEQLENELRDRVIEIKKEQELAETMRQDYEKKIHSAKKEASEIRNKAVDESEKMVVELNRKIENIIREIRESNAEKETIKRAHVQIDEMKQQVVKLKATEQAARTKGFQIGDPVLIKGTLLAGEVVEKSNEKGELLVEVNGLKMRVHESELQETTRSKMAKGEITVEVQSGIPTEVDIRGMRPYEIQTSVEKFLDDAYLGGLKQVEIVHGTGTGSLRRAVEQLLKVHPFVVSFRTGELGEGGQGVTVVSLRAD